MFCAVERPTHLFGICITIWVSSCTTTKIDEKGTKGYNKFAEQSGVLLIDNHYKLRHNAKLVLDNHYKIIATAINLF